MPGIAQTPPIETILVVGSRTDLAVAESAVLPVREGRLATLDDLFRGAPGILVQPAFGGLDHPRFAIRGSGLQRGTQPAGRGIDLRYDGLPMTYADSAFDFVEWIEPLSMSQVRVFRGGRGAAVAGGALGGVVDFLPVVPQQGPAAIARADGGSFGRTHAQGQLSLADSQASAVLSVAGYAQQGFRDHNSQRVAHANAAATVDFTPSIRGEIGLLWSNSRLLLPGPQSLAQINAGSRAAQPGNVSGNWRRTAERWRTNVGLAVTGDRTEIALDAAFLASEVDFFRRDEQLENSSDWSARASVRQQLSLGARDMRLGAELVWQQGRRNQRMFLNGGGTLPTYTGERGLEWADNQLEARRITAIASASLDLGEAVTLDLAGGGNWNQRVITDSFPTRPARPPATYSGRFAGVIGNATLSYRTPGGLDLFLAGNRITEAPTFDVIMTNIQGRGSGPMLVFGPDPRRPVINEILQQSMTGIEAGASGGLGPLEIDVTLFRSWLRNEIVSTADFVQQVVSSVGNADRTRRLGIEASVQAPLAFPGWQEGDRIGISGTWTWVAARFADDPTWGDNRLPVQPPHVLDLALAYDAPLGLFGGLMASVTPVGGWADYANTLRDGCGYSIGVRAGWRGKRLMAFIDARNLTDSRYAATVIAAQNNLAGRDAFAFAPQEGRAINGGVEFAF